MGHQNSDDSGSSTVGPDAQNDCKSDTEFEGEMLSHVLEGTNDRHGLSFPPRATVRAQLGSHGRRSSGSHGFVYFRTPQGH